MGGRWHAFLPTAPGARDQPRVHELKREQDWCHSTKSAALAALEQQTARELKAAQERAAELGRALAAIREMEA